MNNAIQTFTAPTGVQLRTVNKDGQIFFVGKDAAEALGYEAPRNAIKRHVDDDDKLMHRFSASGQEREMTIINESGLYSLILSSKLEEAKQFKKWVTSEVLPAIRKSGGYMVDIANETPEETMARALLVANETMNRQKERLAALEAKTNEQALELAQQDITIKEQQLALEVAAPKALFADAVAQSDTCILIGELAKLLRQNGVEIGQNRLWKWMRDNRYICKANTQPTQRAMEQGLFRVIERSVVDGNGCTRLCLTTKVTGKGQQYFINQFLKATV
jgi:anti-repressor protein